MTAIPLIGECTPAVAVIFWPVQYVAWPGGPVSVGSTVRSISEPTAGDAGRLFSLSLTAGNTSIMNRARRRPAATRNSGQISSVSPARIEPRR